MPKIRDSWDYQIAFLFPAALMVLAFAFFAIGKPFYAREVIVRPKRTPEATRRTINILIALAVGIGLLVAIVHTAVLFQKLPDSQYWKTIINAGSILVIVAFIANAPREHRAVIFRLLGLFIVVAFFWGIFDQAPTTWTFFARDHLDRHLFPAYAASVADIPAVTRLDNFWRYELSPDQLQTLNPVLVVSLLPFVTLFWKLLDRSGIHLRPTTKMMFGFVLTGSCMAIMAAAGYLAGPTGKVWVMWEVVAYIAITVAEICISVVGLELSFAAAPKSMKSFIGACWLLPVFFGNIMNTWITPFYGTGKYQLEPAHFFTMLALMMIPVTFAFAIVAWRFNRDVHKPSVDQMTE